MSRIAASRLSRMSGDAAEEVAGERDGGDPERGAHGRPDEEVPAVHPADAGDQRDVGAHDRHEAPDDQGLGAVLLEEVVGLVEVLLADDPAVVVAQRRPDRATDLVADDVAREGCDEERGDRDREGDVSSPPAMKMPIANRRESPGRIGKNRPHSTKTMTSEIQKRPSRRCPGGTGGPSSWGPSACITGSRVRERALIPASVTCPRLCDGGPGAAPVAPPPRPPPPCLPAPPPPSPSPPPSSPSLLPPLPPLFLLPSPSQVPGRPTGADRPSGTLRGVPCSGVRLSDGTGRPSPSTASKTKDPACPSPSPSACSA